VRVYVRVCVRVCVCVGKRLEKRAKFMQKWKKRERILNYSWMFEIVEQRSGKTLLRQRTERESSLFAKLGESYEQP